LAEVKRVNGDKLSLFTVPSKALPVSHIQGGLKVTNCRIIKGLYL